MEPGYESPPGLALDLSVLRAMLGEQADLIRTSSEQNLEKLQGAWIERFEQLWDKVAAQNTFVQQLSERCRYLEDQLQQLMTARHRAEAATATKVIQNSGSGNVRNELQQLAERSGSETTSAALVTVTPACGNAKKKRARRRTKAKAKHEGFEVQDDLGLLGIEGFETGSQNSLSEEAPECHGSWAKSGADGCITPVETGRTDISETADLGWKPKYRRSWNRFARNHEWGRGWQGHHGNTSSWPSYRKCGHLPRADWRHRWRSWEYPSPLMHIWIPGPGLRGHLGRTAETSVSVRHDGEWLQLNIC